MNQNQKQINQILSDQSKRDQYASPPIGHHTHNGKNSPRVSYGDLVNPFYLAGVGTMAGGKLDITDPRIMSTTIGVAIRANESDVNTGLFQLAGGFLSGHTFRFFEGSFSKAWQLFYIIIFIPT